MSVPFSSVKMFIIGSEVTDKRPAGTDRCQISVRINTFFNCLREASSDTGAWHVESLKGDDYGMSDCARQWVRGTRSSTDQLRSALLAAGINFTSLVCSCYIGSFPK